MASKRSDLTAIPGMSLGRWGLLFLQGLLFIATLAYWVCCWTPAFLPF
ncbi:MAG: hypothetical protein JXB35_02260 [Anaerolineae bacterium]|nr:hypothetical protein [Anaerolineae bacterium]